MCLAIPGKILEIEKSDETVFLIGKVTFSGVTKKINLSLVPEAKIGDHVLVHVGVAVSIIDEEEAEKTLNFLQGTGDLDELFDDLMMDKKP
jgi:hydrogenase expression/formation protein HypC